MIGRYNIQDIVNLNRNISDIQWSYLTDSKFDYDIINGDFSIHYNENVLMGILEIKEDFDYVIILKNIVSDYSRKDLLDAVSNLVDTKHVILFTLQE